MSDVFVNIPSQCRSLFSLICSLADAVNDKPLPQGVYAEQLDTGLVLHSGASGIFLSNSDMAHLRALPADAASHLTRTSCHVFVACFAGARADYLAHQLNKGELIAARTTKDSLSTPKRIAHLMGVDADNAATLNVISQSLTLLSKIVFKFKISKKLYSCTGLIKRSAVACYQGSELPHGLRGGTYALVKIHPELFNLALKKFAQVPLALINSGKTRAVLHGFSLLVEQAYKNKHPNDVLEYDSQRFFRDTGSSQTLRPGDKRELNFIRSSLKLLEELNIVECFDILIERGVKKLLFVMLSCPAKRRRDKIPQPAEAALPKELIQKVFDEVFQALQEQYDISERLPLKVAPG